MCPGAKCPKRRAKSSCAASPPGPVKAPSRASMASSRRWRRRSTSSTCASCCRNIAAMPSAPSAAASACAPKPAPCASTASISARPRRLPSPAPKTSSTTCSLSPMQEEIAGPILDEVRQRLKFLDAVGLEYLTLDRLASTLSGGEAQRIQLATSLGSRSRRRALRARRALHRPAHPRHRPAHPHPRRICATWVTRSSWSSTIPTFFVLPIICSISVRAPANSAASSSPKACSPKSKPIPNSLTGRYLSGQIAIPVPTRRPRPGPRKAGAPRRHRQQPAQH